MAYGVVFVLGALVGNVLLFVSLLIMARMKKTPRRKFVYTDIEAQGPASDDEEEDEDSGDDNGLQGFIVSDDAEMEVEAVEGGDQPGAVDPTVPVAIPRRKPGRPKKVKEEVPPEEFDPLEVSITISAGSRDIEGVVRIKAKSARTVNPMVKKAVGWEVEAPTGFKIMCKQLVQEKLHTWHGMIGYCMKDIHEPHHHMVEKEVSSEDTQIGLERFLMYGADVMKNRVALDLNNFWPRLHVFHRYSPPWLGENFRGTIVRMVRSGKFYPSARWVVPTAGRGMVLARAQACWKMMVEPGSTTKADVDLVFFADGAPGRYFSTDEPLTIVSSEDSE